MGEVVQLRDPQATAPPSVGDEFEGLHHYGTMGGLHIIVGVKPGERDYGPYHVIIRSTGKPDRSIVNMSLGEGTSAQMMQNISGYCQAIWLALEFANFNPELMPNAFGRGPETA